jgi:hypothetical protein
MSLKVKTPTNGNKYSKKDPHTFAKLITDEIENIWSYYMNAFEYENYYKDTFKNFNGKTNTEMAVKKLQNFFVSNNIYDTADYNLVLMSEESNNSVFSNVKLWIMYIISVYPDIELSETVNIFNNALKHDIDRLFLFEYFLILISRLDSYKITQLNDIEIPNEFRLIYYNNRKSLQTLLESNSYFNIGGICTSESLNDSSIRFNNMSFNQMSFNKDFSFQCDDDMNEEEDTDINKSHEERLNSIMQCDLTQDMMNDDDLIELTPTPDKSPSDLDKKKQYTTKSPTLDIYLRSDKLDDEEQVKSSDEETNFNLEKSLMRIKAMEDFTLITNNFNGNGKFAIFKINNKELIEEYECDVMITPLLPKFESFKEKMEVNSDLAQIREMYMYFVYFPYDFKLKQFFKHN